MKLRPLSWWGKARPGHSSEDEPAYHPLPYHSLDVAAVGVRLLEQLPLLRRLFGRHLGLAEHQVIAWVAFWLALHDLGKFAESFQSQRADLFVLMRGRAPSRSYTLRHDSLGMLFWTEVVRSQVIEESWFGPESENLADGLDCWVRASTGHHGQPPRLEGYWQDHFNKVEDKAAAQEHIQAMRGIFLDGELVARIAGFDASVFLAVSEQLSWWMAGLAVLADWLGSNTQYFPYQKVDVAAPMALTAYWEIALQNAEAAIAASGVISPVPSALMTFDDLFPGIPSLSPLQHWAAAVTLPDGPQLHCLEDVTGAGKTEAALMLTHRLMASGRATGFYIALPTMATANAMYARLAVTYRRLFADPASFILATSGRSLVEEFAATVVEDMGKTVLPADAAEGDSAQNDETASARCSAWLADHHKRALLSPAGVGTIDQVLLAVLHSKHQSLRLLGLTGKVLVVDEVHACDDYMLRVLSVLLEFHARGGGSVVLLSATLPQFARQTLMTAFARGLGRSAPQLASTAYPLATSWSVADDEFRPVTETAIATRPDVQRTIAVVFHEEVGETLMHIRAALADGRCVCWVRNTVADAIAAFSMFESELSPDHLLLFHARFALLDRLEMEHQVLRAFGKDSGPDERAGRLLIATQVVEQSLDVDFDLIVSDLAPIDRLIQRAGRLHRHRRRADGARQSDPAHPDARGPTVLHLLCPPWAESPGASWYKTAFPKAAAVYPNHAQLWMTMRALRNGAFTMPDDARPLIEGVFGPDAVVPAGLEAIDQSAKGNGFAAQSQAMMNTLKPSQGYTSSQSGGVDWWGDAHTPSRLGEASSNVTLARWDGHCLRPWADRLHGWAYSTLRMAERSIAATAKVNDPILQAAIDQALESMPAQGRWTVLLPMQMTKDGWVGEALAPESRGQAAGRRTWRYAARRGLEAFDSRDENGDTV